jgi:hypothetical protein
MCLGTRQPRTLRLTSTVPENVLVRADCYSTSLNGGAVVRTMPTLQPKSECCAGLHKVHAMLGDSETVV